LAIAKNTYSGPLEIEVNEVMEMREDNAKSFLVLA
jgi:hypothetical protein